VKMELTRSHERTAFRWHAHFQYEGYMNGRSTPTRCERARRVVFGEAECWIVSRIKIESDCFGLYFAFVQISTFTSTETFIQVSMLSPFPSLPPVDLVLGTTFREKSTCFVPWWILDELITSMSSHT